MGEHPLQFLTVPDISFRVPQRSDKFAKRFAEFGAKLIISSRKIESCRVVEKEINEIGGTAFSKECNISKKSQCEELIDFCIEKYGRLDVLV